MKRRFSHQQHQPGSSGGGGDGDAKKSRPAGPGSKGPKPLSGNKKGTFEHRFERRRYLLQLLQEFQTSPAMECKQQVLANLANFGYDPYNYHFFQELGVIPVFLAELSVDRNRALTEFAMAGLCNCVADRRMQKEILRNDQELKLLKKHVHSPSVDVLLSLITTLHSFTTGNPELKDVILSEDFSTQLEALSKHEDKRVQNVVQVLQEELQL